MPITTPKIRYSLKNRGRKYTGQDRNFNTRLICDAINSPACQEMVSSRGMVGYYGHFPRLRFGMMPSEGGLDGGKYVPVDPAFVTTYLSSDPEGNIEHQAEFLDTAAGLLAAKLWNGKVGGFSSAIDKKESQFFGFDYVVQPNYLGNSFRGVVLDDVLGGNVGEITYDDIWAAEQEEHAQAMIVLLDGISNERDEMNAVIERLQLENEQYLSMLAKRGIDPALALDSASILPARGVFDSVDAIQRDMDLFDSMKNLPMAANEKFSSGNASDGHSSNPVYSRILSRFIR